MKARVLYLSYVYAVAVRLPLLLENRKRGSKMTLLSCFSPKKARVFTILRNTVREPFAKFGDKYRFVFKFAARINSSLKFEYMATQP